jgi:hypothetical protein
MMPEQIALRRMPSDMNPWSVSLFLVNPMTADWVAAYTSLLGAPLILYYLLFGHSSALCCWFRLYTCLSRHWQLVSWWPQHRWKRSTLFQSLE